MNSKLIPPILRNLLNAVTDSKRGFDEDEIDHISEGLASMGCGRSFEELQEIAREFDALPRDKKLEIANQFIDLKFYEEDVCKHFNTNRATLMRWQAKGKLPKWRHEAGGKNYLFFDECICSVRRWDEEHSKKTDSIDCG